MRERLRRRQSVSRVQLFCVPYAGGTAEFFNLIAKYMPEHIELIATEYAGHGKRRKEDFYDTFEAMVRDVAGQINDSWDGESEVALFGYSMGSIVTYEMWAMGLLEMKPGHIFLAAHEAPDIEWESKKVCTLGTQEFADFLVGLGGFDKFNKKMLENRHFMGMFFNPIREDYRLIGMYKMSSFKPFDMPVTMMHSSKDVSKEQINKWMKFFGTGGKILDIGNTHFFMKEEPEKVAQNIIDDIG